MKKVMKTFTFGSKGFMRILLLCMIACFSLTQARADYYYKVKLQNKETKEIEKFTVGENANSEWSDWIFVSKGEKLINALSKLVGETHSEQEKDNNGKLKFKYKDNDVEREISFTEDERAGLKKNGDGKYIYVNGGKEYVLDPVMKYSATLGVTIHDLSKNEITLGYTDAGTTVENEDNCYKNRTHTYKIVGMAIGRGTDEGNILQYSDHAAFGRMKDDLIVLDLAAWNKETFTGSYYMSNMSNLETLILPDHNFAIGDKYMFAGAKKLKEIKYGNYGQNNNAATVTINTATDKCKVTCIGEGAFESCYNLPDASIREMISSVAKYITNNKPTNESGLKYNKIGDNAFYHCYKFAGEFKIPDVIQYIGMQAFEKCNITKLTCTSELKEIGDRAFKQNYKLHTVDLSNINKIGVEAFDMKNDDNNKPVLSTVSLGGNDIRIYSKAFRRCCYMTEFELKNGAQIKQLNDGVFLDCRLITDDAVQTIINNYATNSDQYYEDKEGAKFIPANLFYGANGKPDYGEETEKNTLHKNLTTITIPSEFVVIGKGAFGVSETSNIKSITVSRGVAPQCGVFDGTNSDVTGKKVFEGVNPNYVTVYFNGDAAGYSTNGSTGYMTYRNEPEFMRLMTKTLKEDDETYDVYPQMYADVKLTRSFKQGWNTLALPFGSPSYPDGRGKDCAEVYTDALGATEIAVYRGLRVNNQDASKSVFTFLHYGNVKEDPLDEFEPILVKMPAAAVTKQEYTFENVDLNYDKDNDKLYTAAQILERGCKNSKDGHFDGKYNDGDPVNFPLFNGNNYTTFYFDGTFKMIKDESNSIFKEGDYIIQDGKFIMCKTGKKYGMKAFRGYFKKFDSAPLGAREAINIAVFDGDGTVTDIVRVDANGEAEANAPHDIYNIMGQKVRSNALSTEGLKSGIYIINGKKVLVK